MPVDFEPLVATLPDQPPDAVQELALLEDQVSMALLPFDTVVGPAVNETTGADAAAILMANAGKAAVCAPAETLMTMPASLALPAEGVPDRVPVFALNCAQAG